MKKYVTYKLSGVDGEVKLEIREINAINTFHAFVCEVVVKNGSSFLVEGNLSDVVAEIRDDERSRMSLGMRVREVNIEWLNKVKDNG